MTRTVEFPATDLLLPNGFNGGLVPLPVYLAVRERDDAGDLITRSRWEPILLRIVTDLLLPRIPHEIGLQMVPPNHRSNPARLRIIDGQTWPAPSLTGAISRVHEALAPHQVEIPATTLAHLLIHHAALRLPLSTETLLAAATAGLTAQEIREHHTARTLTADRLTTLITLRTGTHP